MSYDVERKILTKIHMGESAGKTEIQILNEEETFFDVLQREMQEHHCKPDPGEKTPL